MADIPGFGNPVNALKFFEGQALKEFSIQEAPDNSGKLMIFLYFDDGFVIFVRIESDQSFGVGVPDECIEGEL